VRRLSIAGLALMAGGIVGLGLSGALFSPHPVIVAVQAFAVVAFLWARATFGIRSFHAAANPTAGGLVTAGPYRYVRHPIYASILLFAAAGALGRHRPASFFFLAVLAGAALRAAAEERLLVERYPEYRDYARRTRRFIPWVPGL
jgi:protein-S-isoprenylcysteine O-methyltransferase Ste14